MIVKNVNIDKNQKCLQRNSLIRQNNMIIEVKVLRKIQIIILLIIKNI
jgi:hypothetical protein